MSSTPHPRAELSAYHDDALSPSERSAVDSHLASCDDCRARLAELRSVASLIGALADPVPSRRLVPRVGAAPSWLAPLRTLTTIASGLSVFLFIASALLTNVNQLTVGTAGQAAAPAAANAATAGATAERGAAGAPSSNQVPAADSAKGATAQSATPAPTAAPSSAAFSVGASSAAPADALSRSDQGPQHETARSSNGLLGPSPWLWLALAVILGAIAIALQRRLRSV